MGRIKKHCNECESYSKTVLKIQEHDVFSSVPEIKRKEYGFCDKFCDILPNDPDLLINMARGCEYYDK